MCNAIPLAGLLALLAAGLTLLRLARPGSPNADLVTEALLTLEDGPRPHKSAAHGPAGQEYRRAMRSTPDHALAP